MVKFGLMVLMSSLGIAGGLVYAPFAPAAVYHFFAVLRPQFLWASDLERFVPADFPWSMFLALSAIAAAVVWRVSYWVAPQRFPGVTLPKFNIGHVLMGVFAIWITATYLNAGNPEVSEPFYADYRKIFIMFFATCLVMVTVRQIGLLYLFVTFALVFIAFEDNQLYYFHGRYNFRDRTFAGLDNNGAALLMAMGVPLCVYAWDGIRHWSRWFFPIGAVLIVHAVLISQSRGAMAAVAMSSLLFIVRARNKGMMILAYLVGGIIVLVLAGNQIQDRFNTIFEADKDASAQNRRTTWRIAAQMANERPMLGYGVRNSSLYTHKYGADEEGRVIHSTYLQLAADSGYVGLGTYLAFLGGAFYCGIRACNRAHKTLKANPHDRQARWAYTAACGAEGALVVWTIGAAFLSLETFEPPYILAMLAIQLWSIVRLPATDGIEKGSISP